MLAPSIGLFLLSKTVPEMMDCENPEKLTNTKAISSKN